MNGRDAGIHRVARRRILDFLSVDLDGSTVRFSQVRDDLDKLLLSVSVDAGQTYDLACMNRQIQILQNRQPSVVAGLQIVNLKDRFAGLRGFLVYRQTDLVTDHHIRELRLSDIRDLYRVDVLPAPDNRAFVGRGFNFPELVRDDNDGLAVIHESVHDTDEVFDFLGRQNRRRFVENQDIDPAVQSLQYFNTLLHAHSDIGDLRVGIHLQSVAGDQLFDFLLRALQVEDSAALRRFLSEDDILSDCKVFDEHEMLMDHADAVADRDGRIFDVDLFAVQVDFTAVLAVESVQNVHQRRFARAVFAEDRVNGSLFYIQLYVIEGPAGAEGLRNIVHLNCVFFIWFHVFLLLPQRSGIRVVSFFRRRYFNFAADDFLTDLHRLFIDFGIHVLVFCRDAYCIV